MADLFSFFTPAMAQDAGGLAAGSQSSFASFIPLVLMLGVFYFLLIRPQQKKMKEHKAMVEALRRGDKVITASGIMGTVNKIETETGVVHLEIAPDVVIKVIKSAVTEVTTKPVPAIEKKSKQ